MGGAVRVGRLAGRDFRPESRDDGARLDRSRAPYPRARRARPRARLHRRAGPARATARHVFFGSDPGCRLGDRGDSGGCRRQAEAVRGDRGSRQPGGAHQLLVERVPEGRTSPANITRAVDYLRALGRFPIVLKKAIPGYVVGRVSAAVWRECIDLVLRGIISVDDLDRAVSLGPAIGWAAAGPHLTYHLAAGEGGIRYFTQQLLASFESWWQQLAHWAQLDPEQQRALIQSIEKSYKGKVEFLREARDRRLSAILKALEQARAPSGSESG